MLRWVEIMAYTGGGGAKVKFEAPFFCLLNDQILVIEDYAYEDTDFRGDRDLPLPPGAQWGDIGKKQYIRCWLFLYFYVLFFSMDDKKT